jgi:predicted nuclease of restriction endonuclease-like (RecB) superfamily
MTDQNLSSQSLIIQKLKNLVKTARVQAMMKANTELIKLYFQMGKELVADIDSNKGQSNIVKEASVELIKEYGSGSGYSERNLNYMVKFYREIEENSELQRLVAVVPWGHICTVLDRCKAADEKTFYLKEIIKNGYSRNTLIFQITNKLFNRIKQEKTHNFGLTLPENSDLADEIVKNEYVLALTGSVDYRRERNVEQGIL